MSSDSFHINKTYSWRKDILRSSFIQDSKYFPTKKNSSKTLRTLDQMYQKIYSAFKCHSLTKKINHKYKLIRQKTESLEKTKLKSKKIQRKLRLTTEYY